MKQNNQKLKCYLVYRYLMENSDENHCISAEQIISYLDVYFGISAERRSIYKDIDEINKTLYALRKELSIEEAEFKIEEKENDKWKTIVYDGSKKGYYVRKRDYKLSDVNAIVECIYAARFITEEQAEKYVEIITRNLVSIHQADEIQHEALLLDRGKAIDPQVFKNVQMIYKAMRVKSGKEKHVPEKISFKYIFTTAKGKAAERRKGERYVVSPFKLIINDGKYYLLCVDDKRKNKTCTFRVDRMREIKLLGIPRDGAELFQAIDEKKYPMQHFEMYGGKTEFVELRFVNTLLDTVIDKFGKDIYYQEVDKKYFSVQVEVAITEQFFGWICGLGKRVKIISPPPVQKKFKEFLDKIRNMY